MSLKSSPQQHRFIANRASVGRLVYSLCEALACPFHLECYFHLVCPFSSSLRKAILRYSAKITALSTLKPDSVSKRHDATPPPPSPPPQPYPPTRKAVIYHDRSRSKLIDRSAFGPTKHRDYLLNFTVLIFAFRTIVHDTRTSYSSLSVESGRASHTVPTHEKKHSVIEGLGSC